MGNVAAIAPGTVHGEMDSGRRVSAGTESGAATLGRNDHRLGRHAGGKDAELERAADRVVQAIEENLSRVAEAVTDAYREGVEQGDIEGDADADIQMLRRAAAGGELPPELAALVARYERAEQATEELKERQQTTDGSAAEEKSAIARAVRQQVDAVLSAEISRGRARNEAEAAARTNDMMRGGASLGVSDALTEALENGQLSALLARREQMVAELLSRVERGDPAVSLSLRNVAADAIGATNQAPAGDASGYGDATAIVSVETQAVSRGAVI